MGRGFKKCSHCGGENGNRSRACRHCGMGFIVNGVLQLDIEVERPASLVEETTTFRKRDKKVIDYRRGLWQEIKPCLDPEEDYLRTRYYGKRSKTWESTCGAYRVRQCRHFMGVSVKLDDNKAYRLMIKKGEVWTPLSDNARYRTLLLALKAMLKHRKAHDGTPQANGTKDKLGVQLRRVRSRKVVNAS